MAPPSFTSFAVKRNDGTIMCVDAIDVKDLFANRLGEAERRNVQSVEPYEPKLHLKSWEYEEYLVNKAAADAMPGLTQIGPGVGAAIAQGARIAGEMDPTLNTSALEEAVRRVLTNLSNTAENVTPPIVFKAVEQATELERAIQAAQNRK